MGNELDKAQRGLTVEIKLADVAKLAEAADALYSGKYAWVCTACGSRAVGWQLDPETGAALLEAVTQKHAATSRGKCAKPVLSLTFDDVDAAKLLGTPAAAIRASAQPVGLPAPAATGSAGMGPWAKPDLYRCG